MKPVVLVIMDGFGINKESYGNAIAAANTPNLDKLFSSYPNTLIGASGMAVGLPDGQMGNSEVGHTNIGAGRVVYQELTRISKSITDGDFYKNPAFLGAIAHCKSTGGALHLMGLLSDGGVHSHNSHLYALLKLAKAEGLTKVFIHCLLDGRDVPPASGAEFIEQLLRECDEIGVGKIATVMGRYYAMDRDNRFDRVEKAYNAMVLGEGAYNPDPAEAVRLSYDSIDEQGKNITDEFVLPTVCTKSGKIGADDSVIFFNFRPDRAREITRCFVDPDFAGFKCNFLNPYFVTLTQYDATMPNVHVAYMPQSLDNTLGEYLSSLGKTQLRIAETEKYAHVTFFFNGGVETVFPGEDRVLIPSPKVPTYDLQPEMSAVPVCDSVVERIESGKYDVIILNFANCDMVGHTGIMEAAVKAVETVDTCVGRVVEATLKMGGAALITADHGNADRMMEPDGSPFTAHTTNLVPFIAVSNEKLTFGSGAYKLSDISPTILKLIDLPVPAEMGGESIIV